MPHEIQLDGTEITIIKALGLSGSDVDGATLKERCGNLQIAEIVSTLRDLMSVGYVDGDEISHRDMDQFDKLRFRVNSGWSKDLKEALNPEEKPTKSKRVRRE